MDRLITTDPRAAPGQGVVRYDARRRGLPCRARDVGIATACTKVFGTEAHGIHEIVAAGARRNEHELLEHELIFGRPRDFPRRRRPRVGNAR